MSSPILAHCILPKKGGTEMFTLINIEYDLIFTSHRIGQQPIVNIQAVPNYSKSKWTSVT